MDYQSPVFIALAVVALTAIMSWAYDKYLLKNANSEKVLAKTAFAGVTAAMCVLLYVRQFEQTSSLHADPFFAPM